MAQCPICDRSAVKDYLPFCSKRCADVDLHRWLTGSYAVPAMEDDSDGVGDSVGDSGGDNTRVGDDET